MPILRIAQPEHYINFIILSSITRLIRDEHVELERFLILNNNGLLYPVNIAMSLQNYFCNTTMKLFCFAVLSVFTINDIILFFKNENIFIIVNL